MEKQANNEASSSSQNNDKKEDQFKKELAEVREIQRQKRIMFRKAQGLHISSDEDDESNNKVKTEEKSNLKKLPRELEEIKNQKKRLDVSIQELRCKKHQDFVNKNAECEMKKCSPNCADCKKYSENQKKQNETVFIAKQLPKELKNIKISRAIIQNSFDEIKKQKRQEYYKNSISTANKSLSTTGNTSKGHQLGGIPLSNNEISRVSELDQDLALALERSIYDAGNGNSFSLEDSYDTTEDDF